MNLRAHKRRAYQGMADRFARIPRQPGTRIYWRHWTRAAWDEVQADQPQLGRMRWCRWLSWTWGLVNCEVGPRRLMERGLR